jgi:tRNA(Ile)-lysidine synthase
MARMQMLPEQKVLRFINEHHLVPTGQKLVVAVSGGPDSVCLLHVLCGLRRELKIELYAAHLDHRLRGKASAADAAYVAGLARKLGLPATIEARDVKAYRKESGLSLEEAAREVRYAFLAEVAAREGAARVAVGHTATDHVETILMHLVRGSGVRGLRGMLPSSTLPVNGKNLIVIRPLLELTREETAAYCCRHRLYPRHDASNDSPELFRNRIRRELLPLLRDYNPRVDEALQRTARIAADDLSFIDNEVAVRYEKIARLENEAVILDKTYFMALPVALQRYILRRALESLLGNLKDIEAGHIEEVLAALAGPSGKAIGLPGGLSCTIEPARYLLARDAAAACPFPALAKEYPLQVPGRTRLPGGEMMASIIRRDEAGLPADDFTAFFDFDKTGADLVVRRRRAGDRFQPLGLPGLKKLGVFLIDARVPRSWRGRIPIVTAPGQIIWVTGWRIDERAKVTAGTEKVLRLEFRRS